MKNFILKIISIALIISCNSEPESVFNRIQDKKAREVIKKSVAFHGGLAQWQAIQKLSYQKDFTLYTASGEVEGTYGQKHNYDYTTSEIIIRTTKNDSVEIETGKKNNTFYQLINGKSTHADEQRLQASISASNYVLGIPFKLLDKGAAITYIGKKQLGAVKAHEIQVKYDAQNFDNHASSETWRYYFHPNDYNVMANWVRSDDHFNWIENLSFQQIEGLRLHGKRRSYRVDSLGNELYLRAHYSYYGYILK